MINLKTISSVECGRVGSGPAWERAWQHSWPNLGKLTRLEEGDTDGVMEMQLVVLIL